MFIPTRIVYGMGKLKEVHLQQLPGKKALILTTNGKSTKANGYLDILENELDLAGIAHELFCEIEANPLKQTVMNAAAFAKEKSCDFIIALGGGSCIDASKAIAGMATNNGDLWDYMMCGTGKNKRMEQKPLPIVTIPTTAGTGSEVDQWGAIINEETNEKISFGNDTTYPVLAIYDPELTKSVPAKFTAYQGFDAFFHLAERYVSKFANDVSDAIVLKAIENIMGNIETAVKDGSNMKARERIASGNMMAGISMSLSRGTSEHALENAMTGFHPSLPHGAGLLMICEAYFTFLADHHICDERLVTLAKAMGAKNATEPMDMIQKLVSLMEACNVYGLKMSDYGINKDEFRDMAGNAKATMPGCMLSERIELTEEDCIWIYDKSFQ